MTALISSPLRWLGGKIDIRVEVEILSEGGGVWDIGEWDTAHWATYDWYDITQYVESIRISRGQPKWESRYSAGSLELTLDNTSGLFTPEVEPNLDAVPWRPGRKIRVLAYPDPTDSETFYPLFTGRIVDSSDAHDFSMANVVNTTAALDALADLQAFNPLALETATGVQSTSERVHAALDRIGWPMEQRVIQEGLHTMQTSFLAQTTLEECQRAAEAEGGALWADEHNRIVFKNRDWLQGGTPTMDDYAALVLSLEPLAYWRMGDDTNHSTDSSGNGHTLTWSGSPTTGVEGVMDDDVAVSLDSGSAQHATVANEDDLEITGSLSVEAWVKVASFNFLGGAVFSVRNASGEALYQLGCFTPDVGGSGEGRFFFGGSESQTLASGEWVHLVGTLVDQGGTRTTRLYVNGEYVGNQYSTSDPAPSGPFDVYVGRAANTGIPFVNNIYFDGDISELAIYDKALTPAQVLSLYQAKDTGANIRSTEIQGYLGYPEQTEIEYLIVGGGGPGGGGGSGNGGSGGGAGGVITGSEFLAAGSYPVVVGAGGDPHQNNGGNSSFNGLTALGGGHGGRTGTNAYSAGSGGSGGGAEAGGTPGSGTVGQGHDGGQPSTEAGGGGGGAGEPGGDGGPGARDAGDGGDGIEWPAGSGEYYGGGGGGSNGTGGGGGQVSAGGLGGGGFGHSGTGAAGHGEDGRGGGGGGSRAGTPGSGGDGVVIIRYPSNSAVVATGGTVTEKDGYTYHTFTSSGTFEVESNPGPPPGATKAHILSIKPSWDINRIVNHISMARSGGEAYLTQDFDSQAQFGIRTYQFFDMKNALNSTGEAEVKFLADRMLAARKDLRLRIDSVTIAANADPNNEDLNRLFYATQFGDLLAVNLDSGRGWGYERLGHVIGIEHNITAEDWEVTFILDDAALAIAPPEESNAT